MKVFENKVAVITGAASGLGLALAEHAAGLGMHLVLADIDEPALRGVTERLRATAASVHAQPCDVARSDDVATLAHWAQQNHGVVHLLFNNAGVGTGNGLAWETRLVDWQWSLGVNLWGVIHGIHHFVPGMVAAAKRDPQYQGRVINTSSMSGFFNSPIMAAYNAGKHAVTAISETLHHDLALVGVDVGCSLLAPYFVATGITQSERHRPAHLVGEQPPPASQQVQIAQADEGMAWAASGAGLSAVDVARITFEAIREQRFYVFTHPGMLRSVERRMAAILGEKDPVDPFDFRPQVAEALKAQLAFAGPVSTRQGEQA